MKIENNSKCRVSGPIFDLLYLESGKSHTKYQSYIKKTNIKTERYKYRKHTFCTLGLLVYKLVELQSTFTTPSFS
jgi:hypothetical protein